MPDVFSINILIIHHINSSKKNNGSAPLNELHTTPKNNTVVLVSRPGVTHNVLLNFLLSLPHTTCFEAYGALSAFEFIESHQVDVVVVNANLILSEKLALVRRIKSRFSSIKCIVLTVTTRDHESIRTSGADQVLLEDTSLGEMERMILA